MIDAVHEWLSTKHCTLWGEGFTIKDDRGLAHATEWWFTQLVEFSHFVCYGPPDGE